MLGFSISEYLLLLSSSFYSSHLLDQLRQPRFRGHGNRSTWGWTHNISYSIIIIILILTVTHTIKLAHFAPVIQNKTRSNVNLQAELSLQNPYIQYLLIATLLRDSLDPNSFLYLIKNCIL